MGRRVPHASVLGVRVLTFPLLRSGSPSLELRSCLKVERERRGMPSSPTRNSGTPGKGNRDAKGAPHKAGESPALQEQRRPLQKAASTRARSRSLPPRRARSRKTIRDAQGASDTAGEVALKRAPTHPLRFCARIMVSGASHGAKRSRHP